MARKYARDNRGRFASTGSGATARGGRLKTASGNKRQSQTMQAKGGPKGTIGKPKGLKPGALKAKPAAKPAAKAGEAASKPKLKRTGEKIKRFRSALPKTTLTYKDALPPAPSNAPRLQRARNIKQNATSKSVSFAEMQKLKLQASVAQNPYSDLSKSERTRRINNLAKAELAQRKKDKSYKTAAKAEDVYTNVVGYTQREGRRKWKRAGQRMTSMGAGTIRGNRRRR